MDDYAFGSLAPGEDPHPIKFLYGAPGRSVTPSQWMANNVGAAKAAAPDVFGSLAPQAAGYVRGFMNRVGQIPSDAAQLVTEHVGPAPQWIKDAVHWYPDQVASAGQSAARAMPSVASAGRYVLNRASEVPTEAAQYAGSQLGMTPERLEQIRGTLREIPQRAQDGFDYARDYARQRFFP